MKNIHQWIKEYNEDDDKNFYDLIKKVQDDAYNQAIEDASESARASIEYDPNSYCGNTGSEYPADEIAVVNKQSILKLKK